jgi:RimJ/RimL family protein N-acetyltransferase
MENSTRLGFKSQKTIIDLNRLWANCFEGNVKLAHVNRFNPPQFAVPNHAPTVFRFLEMASPESWIICRLSDGEPIGYQMFGYLGGHPKEIGFVIGLDYTGQGYATEALQTLCSHLQERGIDRINGHCLDTNLGSIRVMEHCGFVKSGPTGTIYGGISEIAMTRTL